MSKSSREAGAIPPIAKVLGQLLTAIQSNPALIRKDHSVEFRKGQRVIAVRPPINGQGLTGAPSVGEGSTGTVTMIYAANFYGVRFDCLQNTIGIADIVCYPYEITPAKGDPQ